MSEKVWGACLGEDQGKTRAFQEKRRERLEPAEWETGIASPYLALPVRLWQPPQMHLSPPSFPEFSLARISGVGTLTLGPHPSAELSRNPEADLAAG